MNKLANDDLSTFGCRVKWARKLRKMSQRALADKIGVSQPSLSEMESNESQGSKYTAQIADFLNVDALWLATGKGTAVLKSREVGDKFKLLSPEHRRIVESVIDGYLLSAPKDQEKNQ